MIEAQRARHLSRRASEPTLRAAIPKGRDLAERGALQREAAARFAERPISLEREGQLVDSGSRLGSARATAFRRRREPRAVALGFANPAAFYERRYHEDFRRLDELAAELDCAMSAVRGDLERLGLGPDRTRSHGARWRAAP